MTVNYLNESAAVLYSEILDKAQQNSVLRPDGFSFAPKTRNGIKYWYLQHAFGHSRKQVYIGREDEGTLKKIMQQKAQWELAKQDQIQLEKLTSMAIMGGCSKISGQAYKVLSSLEQSGLFSLGCVLAGSYAFQAYGNMLGVEWSSKSMMTQDVDLAADDNCLIAVPEDFKPLGEQILASDEKMLAVGALNHSHPSTSYHVRGKEFRVDVITSLKPNEPAKNGPYYLTGLKTHAHGLRFLDFILKDAQKAVLLHKTAILVNVPDPARFALHKLVISERRPAAEQIKSRKDISQAAQLIEVLLADRPGDLWRAIDRARQYPSPKFAATLLKMIVRLPSHQSEAMLEYWRKENNNEKFREDDWE